MPPPHALHECIMPLQHATCRVLPATCGMPRVACYPPHAACPMCHACHVCATHAFGSMALDQVAAILVRGDERAMHTGRSGGGLGSLGGGSDGDGTGDEVLPVVLSKATLGETAAPRGAVPLACLEADFMHFNRELLLSAAAAARTACDPHAVHAAAGVTRKLYSMIAAQQSGSPSAVGAISSGDVSVSGTGGTGGGSGRQCAPRRLLAVRPHPSGFFSLIHGVIKSFSHAIRNGKVGRDCMHASTSSTRSLWRWSLHACRHLVHEVFLALVIACMPSPRPRGLPGVGHRLGLRHAHARVTEHVPPDTSARPWCLCPWRTCACTGRYSSPRVRSNSPRVRRQSLLARHAARGTSRASSSPSHLRATKPSARAAS